MPDKQRDTRDEILALVDAYAREKQPGSRRPGHDLVHYAGRVFDADELKNVVEAGLDFVLTEDRFTREFSEALARTIGVAHALPTNSGSSANLLAVSALCSPKIGARRLEPGDEVITVAANFPTAVAPLVQNGLIPVAVDVGMGTYNAVPEQVAEAVGPRTKAILLAHTLGNPFDVAAIKAVADRHDLWLIEDNCDALGCLYDGAMTGSFGHLATLSFYPAHHITTGEGGCVVTDDPDLARIVRSFRDWGRDCHCSGGQNNACGKRFSQQFGSLPFGFDHKYVYSHVGYNLRMTELQAAIGCAQLRKLDGFVAARRRNHAAVRSFLKPYDDVLLLPEETKNSQASWFCFVISVRPDAPFSRGDLVSWLEERRIETRSLFAGNLFRHPAYADVAHREPFPLTNTDRITEATFFIGVYPGLTEAHLAHMESAFAEFMKERR